MGSCNSPSESPRPKKSNLSTVYPRSLSMSVSGTYSRPGPTLILTPGESNTIAGNPWRGRAGGCKVPNNTCPLSFLKRTASGSDIPLLQPLDGGLLQISRAPVERLDLAPERLLDRQSKCASIIALRQALQVAADFLLFVRSDLDDEDGARVSFRLRGQQV